MVHLRGWDKRRRGVDMQRRKSLALSIPYQLDFFKQYKFLSQDKPQHILLESGRGGRYNIVGLNPVAVIQGKGVKLHISESGKETIKKESIRFNARIYGEMENRLQSRVPTFSRWCNGLL